MKKFLALIILLFSYNNAKALFTYDIDRLEKKIKEREKEWSLFSPDKIRFTNKNLSKEILSHKTLENIDFYNTNFASSHFYRTYILDCDFEKTDLSYANFHKATLLRIKNLEKAKSVEGANFEGAKYLSNKQKQFLRANGAINVPEDDREINFDYDFDYDFDPEKFHEKVLAVFKTISNGSKETYNWLKRNGQKILDLTLSLQLKN